MNKRLWPLAIFLICPSVQAKDPVTITQQELIRRSQQMYDALVPGNQEPWKLYIADDATSTDEKGRTMDKAALVADVQPMPTGYSGVIHIVNAKSRFAPGVAIVSYDAEEKEIVFGQVLHARYHMTDTWLYRNQLWQIAATQALRYYEDPAAGQVSEARLNDYIGQYELAPGEVMKVTRNGSELTAQRGSAKPYKLLPESPDLFFRPGAEGRKFFHRDASGRVDRLIDRRNNEDIVWKRIE
jgi:putative intracellular protease/amidase